MSSFWNFAWEKVRREEEEHILWARGGGPKALTQGLRTHPLLSSQGRLEKRGGAKRKGGGKDSEEEEGQEAFCNPVTLHCFW
eukprot:2341343-Pyramimonas_sp.AAC.1